MRTESSYLLFADVVLVLHVALVAFVVGGLILIWIGNLRSWRWVNHIAFRLAHLGAIGVVVVQAWLGADCPLTTLEMHLRAQAGQETYTESFIAHWLQNLIYYEAPQWVFTAVYTVFGLAVLVTWWRFPPKHSYKP